MEELSEQPGNEASFVGTATSSRLAAAHRALDEAVFAAYDWPPNLPVDDLLARLLELNLSRA